MKDALPSLSLGDLAATISSIKGLNKTFMHPSQAAMYQSPALEDVHRQVIGGGATLATPRGGGGFPGATQPAVPPLQPQLTRPVPRVVTLQPTAQPANQEVAQEATQYCPVAPCTWVSHRTSNLDLLSFCFNELLVHLKYEHDDAGSGVPGDQDYKPRSSKSHQEFKAATKPRTVQKTMDDASHNLCEARFYSFPMDLKSLGMNLPSTISPIVSVVDLSHLGVDVNNPELMRKLHSRTETNLRLRDFSDTNLRNYHAAGDALVAVETFKSQLQLGRYLKQLEGTKVGSPWINEHG
jgi:hypothetical protein